MKFIIIVLVLFLASCKIKEKKFDKATWNTMNDMFYANRESMIKDLMTNYLHKEMTYSDLIALIGEPEKGLNMKQNIIVYEIMFDYGWDIDPVEGETLINLKMNELKKIF